MPTTVLITGANRGIGYGIVEAYLARPDHIVVATARDTSSMPKPGKVAQGSKLIGVRYDAAEGDGEREMIAEAKKQGVEKLDIVVANAAIMTDDCFAPLAKVDPAVFEQHWRINVLGTLKVFQACVPLMPKGAKFIFMSSGASIIDRVPDKTDATYGITKCNINYLARYSHFENPDLIIWPMSPGWVQTEMGDRGARSVGMKQAPITVEESVSGMLKVIDDATRETTGGVHMRYNGDLSKW
ncbi:hypothetical protein BCR39DRAFT_527952 [Naematelia encephala]|uniref:Uncharacterized protein n=1 Tax=Naematelia encephala TaxID=71784 RepID=A0A1Y2B878_9TREE|nr:hypothetical protein BCR39DRAFT_527952 [Naematelia encephala]